VAQANLRGFYGAFNVDLADVALDESLGLADIVVGLMLPHAHVDGRLFKLVLRLVQYGQIDASHLIWLARKERASGALCWLLTLTPASERNACVVDVLAGLRSLRAERSLDYDYDPERLVRRPYSKMAHAEPRRLHPRHP